MIIAWSASRELGDLIIAHAGAPVVHHAAPGDFLAAVEGAGLVLIAAEDVGDEPAARLINNCRAVRPGLPILVVTRFDPDLSRGLAHVEVDGVVWIREVTERLADAILDAMASPARQRLANLFRHWDDADPLLRIALYEATRAAVPPPSVHALAKTHGVTADWLERSWREVVAAPARLSSFVLLLRSLRFKELDEAGLSNPAIAELFGIDRKSNYYARQQYPDPTMRLEAALLGRGLVGVTLAAVLAR